jgi:hypothetical protein
MAYTRPLLVAVEESDTTLRLRLTGDFDQAGVGAVEQALDRLCKAPASQGASSLTSENSPSSAWQACEPS